MISVVLAAVALAGGSWSGIPSESLLEAERPVFLEPEAGWTAVLDKARGGRVQVFVGHDEAEAITWFGVARSEYEGRTPPFPFADEGAGNGHTLLLFRDANVCVVVEQPGGGAVEVAHVLHGALVEGTPWPGSPEVSVSGHRAEVAGEWAAVRFRPSASAHPETLLPVLVEVVPTGPSSVRLSAVPRHLDVVVWDRFGRFAEGSWRINGSE